MTESLGGAGARDLDTTIRDFLSHASIETIPVAPAIALGFRELLPAGTAVYVVSPPGADRADVVATAAAIARAGLRAVPHIVARQLADAAKFDGLLARLAGAGVEDALVVAGSQSRPSGAFDSASALIETGAFSRHGFRRLGFAGHPEGHPDVAEEIMLAALRRKAEFAAQAGIEARVVTQFCFETSRILSWSTRIAAVGIALPIHVGMPGPVSLRGLVKFAALCRVPLSAGLAARTVRSMLSLATGWTPDRLVRELALARAEGQAASIVQPHFYSFAGLPKTAAWMRAVREGRFRATAEGFEVNPA